MFHLILLNTQLVYIHVYHFVESRDVPLLSLQPQILNSRSMQNPELPNKVSKKYKSIVEGMAKTK